MANKICSKCGKSKSIEGYYRKGVGYRSECIECSKANDKKTCIKCGKTKGKGQFYKGVNRCKICMKEYNKKSRSCNCEVCGKQMYKSNGYTVCYQCRKPEATYNQVACNQECQFYVSCKRRIWQTDDEHRFWQPYCFVSSPYHAAYLEVYA